MIVINIDKAKNIAHDRRRARREELFAPHDEIIMKQIPNKDAASAEQSRADIRVADALVQQAIDASVSVEQLKQVLVDYQALTVQS